MKANAHQVAARFMLASVDRDEAYALKQDFNRIKTQLPDVWGKVERFQRVLTYTLKQSGLDREEKAVLDAYNQASTALDALYTALQNGTTAVMDKVR